MNKDIISILEDRVLPTMRKSGTVSDVNASGTYYVLTVDNTDDIVINDILHLKDASDNDIEAKVVSFVENTSITVISTYEPITGTWNALKPYFRYEKWNAESNRIESFTDKLIQVHKRFPLVFLLLDINENIEPDDFYDAIIPNLKMFIIEKTVNGSGVYAEDRRNQVFIPTLEPIYSGLLSAMKSNKYISNNGRIPHSKINRYFLGSDDVNQNKLNQYVDAIELTFNEIKLINTSTNC